MLYSPDRQFRFDALWRLVFADDETSLAAVREGVPTWTPADRRLAVGVFGEVKDPRPAEFLDFMARDADPAARALALEVRARIPAR